MRGLLKMGALCAILAIPTLAMAAAPSMVLVQGYLTDSEGLPLDGDAILDLVFYASENGGAPLYEETQVVTVSQGYFTVYVGAVEPLDLALFRDQGVVFLGLSVDEDPEMSPRIQIGSTPFAGYAEYCGYAQQAGDASFLGGHAASDFRLSSDTVTWGELSGIPPDLLDGDADTLGGLSCANDGELAKWVAGAWTCSADLDAGGDITGVTAGGGLTGGGLAGDVTLGIDTTAVQARVGGACATGSAIRTINADGTVVCEPDDDSGGDITGVTSADRSCSTQARAHSRALASTFALWFYCFSF